MDKPKQCRFCNKDESINHLFFECAVAKYIWCYVSEFLGFEIGTD
jgi:hypothetical protein